jgi:hypothetical protein
MRKTAAAVVAASSLWSTSSLAYRPFDSTDAAVAQTGEAELELGPVQYLSADTGNFLIVPSVIANVGIVEGTELVLEGRNFVRLGGASTEPRVRLTDAAFSMKTVLRNGSLQEAPGPSIASEVGVLFPSSSEPDAGLGASAVFIVSQRWTSITAHLNGGLALTRSHDGAVVMGLIIEGPFSWRVRPVAEGFFEREVGVATLYSGLVGAIWSARENLSFDAAVRRGKDDGTTFTEVRAGLTWAFELAADSRTARPEVMP